MTPELHQLRHLDLMPEGRVLHLQGVFLQRTTDFYAAEGTRLMQETDVAEYLIHCEVNTMHSTSFSATQATLAV